jgi:hypothetical protein
MPSKSKAQHNFMAAVANNPEFAKKAGVPQSVGKEFSNADKGRKFSKGGDMKSEAMKKGGMPMKMKDGKKVPIFMNKGGMSASSMGKVKTAAPSKDGVAAKGKTKGTQVKMAGSGVPGGIGSRVMKSGGKTC